MASRMMFDQGAARSVGFGRRFVIEAHERGVVTRNGRVEESLDPGAHRRFGRGYSLRRVDIRPFVHMVPTQQIPTADGVTIKATVAVQARVTDPEQYLIANQSALAALHLVVQVALREVVAATTIDDLVQARSDTRTALSDRVGDVSALGQPRSSGLGARVLRCGAWPTVLASPPTLPVCSSSG